MVSRVLQRAGAISAGLEGPHQAQRHARAEGIDRRDSPPPAGRRHVVASTARGLSQRLERRPHTLSEVGPLPVYEPFEFRRAAEMEPVEQRTPVRRDGPLEVLPRERRLEVVEIDGDHVAIEPQVVRPRGDVGRTEVAPQPVEQLRERVVRALLPALGPQIRHQLVPGHTLGPPQREERQQRQGSSLRGRAREGPLVAREGERTERRQPEAGPAADAHLTAL